MLLRAQPVKESQCLINWLRVRAAEGWTPALAGESNGSKAEASLHAPFGGGDAVPETSPWGLRNETRVFPSTARHSCRRADPHHLADTHEPRASSGSSAGTGPRA